jgi:hypothetical protein
MHGVDAWGRAAPAIDRQQLQHAGECAETLGADRRWDDDDDGDEDEDDGDDGDGDGDDGDGCHPL